MTTNRPTALITGASRGLGLALARQLASDGWTLIIDGRNADALRHAASELGLLTQVFALPGDVSDPTHHRSLRDTAQRIGGLDVVVHNASILGAKRHGEPALSPMTYYPLDGLREVLEVNTLAPLALTQLLVPLLRPEARVIAISSDAAVEAYEGWGGYGASKAALDQLFAVLAAERPDLHVYRVDPGEMRTRMYQEAAPGEDISDLPLPEVSVPGLKALLTGDLPSGRYLAREVETAETVGAPADVSPVAEEVAS